MSANKINLRHGLIKNLRLVVAYLADRSKVTNEVRYEELTKFVKSRLNVPALALRMEQRGLAQRKIKMVGEGREKTKIGYLYLHDKSRLVTALEEIDEEIERRRKLIIAPTGYIEEAKQIKAAAGIDLISSKLFKPPQRAQHG